MPVMQNYIETKILTASPMELIIMLYEGAIKSLESAEEAFKIKGPDMIPSVNNHILKAQDIITELSLSLDMEKGGIIAQNLERLYDFMIHNLSNANLRKQMKPVKEVKDLMIDLLEAWRKVAEQEPQIEEQEYAGSKSGTIEMHG